MPGKFAGVLSVAVAAFSAGTAMLVGGGPAFAAAHEGSSVTATASGVPWSASYSNAVASGTWTQSFLFPFPTTVNGTLTVSSGSKCYIARMTVYEDLGGASSELARQCGVGSTPVTGVGDQPNFGDIVQVAVCEVDGTSVVACGTPVTVGESVGVLPGV